MNNHYETLGVAKDADAKAIRAAYRKGARKAHPDRQGGDHAQMMALNIAYAVLSDESRRAHYDKHGEDKPLDSAEQVAQSRLISLMDGFCVNGCKGNPLDIMAEAMREELAKLAAARIRGREILKNVEKLRATVHQGNKGERNIFTGVFDQKTAQINEAIENALKAEEVAKLAIKMLKEYRFTGEAQPKVEANFQIYAYSVGGSHSATGA